MVPKPGARPIALLAMSLGALLLALTAVGTTSALGRFPEAPPRAWESFDPELAAATPDLASLRARALADPAPGASAGEASESVVAERLQLAVAARFTHGSQARHRPCSDWIAWSAGLVWPPAGRVRLPDELLGRSRSGLCGQVSWVLVELARASGLEARQVGLGGHVVAELRVDGAWRCYDPDLELALGGASVAELSAEPGAWHALLEGRGDRAWRERTAALFTDTSDDTLGPPGQAFSRGAELVRRFQVASLRLKWAVPAALLAGGLLALRRRRPPQAASL